MFLYVLQIRSYNTKFTLGLLSFVKVSVVEQYLCLRNNVASPKNMFCITLTNSYLPSWHMSLCLCMIGHPHPFTHMTLGDFGKRWSH